MIYNNNDISLHTSLFLKPYITPYAATVTDYGEHRQTLLSVREINRKALILPKSSVVASQPSFLLLSVLLQLVL